MLKNQYWNIDLLISWNQNQQKNIDFENDQQIQQINICWKSENFVKIRKKTTKTRKKILKHQPKYKKGDNHLTNS